MPLVLAAGGAHESCTVPLPEPVEAALTVMVKPGSDAEVVPSLTEITMSLNAPAAAGVPVSAPVALLKAAQGGRFWILNTLVAAALTLAAGVNA